MEYFLHSLIIYVANFVLVLAVRPVLRRLLSKEFYPYCAEVLGMFLLVANVHENGNVYGQFGLGIFSVCLFLLMMVYARVSDAISNPIVIFEYWWNGKMAFTEGVLKIMAQIIGSLLAARYMTWLWKTAALSEHTVSRAEFLELTCDSANKVSIPEAVAVEMLAAFVLRIFASYRVGGPSLEKYFNAAATIAVILAGLEWTGSMINPALATAMTYNCENHPFYEHVLVYWLAPFMGSILSDYVEDFLHGKGWRDREPTPVEEPHAKSTKKKRPRRSGGKSKKSAKEPVVTAPQGSKNGVSPKRRKRKEANNNVKRNMNVGS